MSMVTVELRNGRKVVAEVKPVKGKKDKDIVIQANVLLYARKWPMLNYSEHFQCEKYGEHNFDGTECAYVVCTKFVNSRIETRHLLCEEHANELYDILLQSLAENPPTPSNNDPSAQGK